MRLEEKAMSMKPGFTSNLFLIYFFFTACSLAVALSREHQPSWSETDKKSTQLFYPGSVAVLPQDGRRLLRPSLPAQQEIKSVRVLEISYSAETQAGARIRCRDWDNGYSNTQISQC